MSKQHHRRGHLKTASSSRALELLETSGHGITFLGFDGYSPASSSLSNVADPVDSIYNELTPEFRIIFKKFSKKDAVTREKALKELDSMLLSSALEDVHKVYELYTQCFSKLIMDGAIIIRSSCLSVLEQFISTLRRNGEELMQDIMPYLLFAVHDCSRQVSLKANNILTKCFTKEKRSEVFDMFASAACRICFRIMDDSHPLIKKADDEETEESRSDRLQAQALRCLRSFCRNLKSADVKPLYSLFSNHSQVKRLTSSSAAVVSATFDLGSRLLSMDNGDTVLNCRLTSVALASINADDRSVARSACAYFVLAAAHDETYKLTNIRQSVIPKLLSAIRKKHRTWSFLAQSIKKLLESFSGRISNDEWKKFLCNVIESFMDGLPWETSFELSSWETSFIECGRFAIQSLSEDDEHLIRVLTQIARSVEVVVWSKNARLCKTLANYYLEILSCEVPSTAISRFRACLFENIVNKLPESSSVAEQLFSRPTDQHLLPLAFSVIGNVSSPPSLLTGLIDRSDDDFIRSLLAKGDCRKIIADRIIFLPEQTAIGLMQTYLRLTHLANGQLSEHFPGGDDVISRTIVAAAVGWNNWNVLKFIVDDEYWKNLEERAIATTVSESESRVWSLMVSAMEHSDNQEHLISKVIENVNANSYRNLFDLCRIVCKMPPSCKLKVLAAVLGFVLEEENAGEVIERSVPFTNEIHVDCNQLANLIYSKLFNAQSIMIKQAEFHSNAVSYVSCLPAQLVCGFMIEKDELVSSTSQIDSMLGAEILDSYEFLSSAVDRTLSNDKKFLKDCCIKSSFILDVLQHADKNATELSSAITLSLAYITAVSFSLSCSPTTSSSITDIELPALEAKLTSFLKENPDYRIKVTQLVLDVFPNDIPLCLLVVLRNYMREESDVRKQSIIDDELRKGRCNILVSAFCCSSIRQIPREESDALYWTSLFENTTWLKEGKTALTLLSFFVSKSRSHFEDSLFLYRPAEEIENHTNHLNCALLRFLLNLCEFVNEMDNSLCDFMMCGVVTSLESCRDNFRNHALSLLFSVFASLSMRLFCRCCSVVEEVRGNEKYRNFVQEWNEFFRLPPETCLLNCFLDFDESRASPIFISWICRSVHFINVAAFKVIPLNPRFDAELDSIGYSEQLQSVILPLRDRLISSRVEVQFAALRILKLKMDEMLKIENSKQKTELESDEGLILSEKKCLPIFCMRCWEDTSPSSSVISSKILIWDAFLSTVQQYETAERVAYFYNMNYMLVEVLPLLFSLIPVKPGIDHYRGEYPSFTSENFCEADSVVQYAFALLFRTFSSIPALVRQWYVSLPKAATSLVKDFTSKYLTPLIWQVEREYVQNHEVIPNLKVRAWHSVSQIIGEYRVEDMNLVLKIQLPLDYPLSVIEIENEKGIVNRNTQRKWLLQLMLFLEHQNGSIMDAISVWVKNIERHLEGVEDCCICMMTVHSVNYQLPKTRCKKCNKKFHSECLYKWFESSGQSSCPLCRASFV